MSTEAVIAFLRAHGGDCPESVEWIRGAGIATLAEAWTQCPRLDWCLAWEARALVLRPGRAGPLRLFAASMVRNTPLEEGGTVWDLLDDERSFVAVLEAEMFARGEVTAAQLKVAEANAKVVMHSARATDTDSTWAAKWAAACCACPDAVLGAWLVMRCTARAAGEWPGVAVAQMKLYRELLPNVDREAKLMGAAFADDELPNPAVGR